MRQILHEHFGPIDVLIIEIESAIIHVRVRRQRRIAHCFDLASIGARLFAEVDEVSEIANGEALGEQVVPDVTGRRQCGWLAAFVVIELAACAVAIGPHALHVVWSNSGRRPIVAVGAHVGVDIEIIEQHEFTGQLVMVGSDLLAEQNQRWIAVALADVAQHLIVCSVFLDDVNDVLDRRWFTGPHRHWIT